MYRQSIQVLVTLVAVELIKSPRPRRRFRTRDLRRPLRPDLLYRLSEIYETIRQQRIVCKQRKTIDSRLCLLSLPLRMIPYKMNPTRRQLVLMRVVRINSTIYHRLTTKIIRMWELNTMLYLIFIGVLIHWMARFISFWLMLMIAVMIVSIVIRFIRFMRTRRWSRKLIIIGRIDWLRSYLTRIMSISTADTLVEKSINFRPLV